jgi:hypothetical protein
MLSGALSTLTRRYTCPCLTFLLMHKEVDRDVSRQSIISVQGKQRSTCHHSVSLLHATIWNCFAYLASGARMFEGEPKS